MPRLTINLPKEINDRLTEIADKERITKAEAMRRAFALLSIAEMEKAKGNSIGIVRENPGSHDLQTIGQVLGV